ncbi:MAG: ThuA domain-containing protein [Opitutaceae bacterium]|nr:ThuA domain-containing protein [Verrucomicrobiales bacterium]
MKSLKFVLAVILFAAFSMPTVRSATPMKALIIDGQNNHDWKSSTPHLKRVLAATGLFAVDVATAPAKGGEMSAFKPKFSDYKVIVSNYSGERWSKETEEALVGFVRNGGGFVPVHAANNSFPDWKEYNEMIGVGGWGGRTEKSGPWLHWEGKLVRDMSPGPGGSHGAQHSFLMVIREPNHPIMKGLPTKWMHSKDELYDRLRGPAENVTVLATAYSDPATKGTGKNESLLFAISFGQGRVFHTALGHNNGPDLTAQQCVGFITTLQRGVEWAATGKVNQKIPDDFPTESAVSVRP